jgi:SHS2 domain-containing protein
MMPGGFELLEHTADIGIRAWGGSIEEAFEQAGYGLAEILGVRLAGGGTSHEIRAEASDVGGLVVDFLNELVLLQESQGVGFTRVEVRRLSSTELEASVWVRTMEGEASGIPVKGATYHQLGIERHPEGEAEIRVYLDV